MSIRLIVVVILSSLVLGLSSSTIFAQADCGLVDGISFPVDTSVFSLTQDFSVPSARHEGRYHMGEDWHGGRDNSLGAPVFAIARGRVTYSSVNGWGRDGGVVIIEHTFPDGTVYYSQYGHITGTTANPFPTRLTCVGLGEPIGVIADVRPAPHLHFEIRTDEGNNSSLPGAGYSEILPYLSGNRDPSKFIINQQIWLSIWHDWHITLGSGRPIDEQAPYAPPVSLNDESILYLDSTGNTLRRATLDGRVLWRLGLSTPAVAITTWQGSSLLISSDGTLATIDVEAGTVLDSWSVDANFTGALLFDDAELLLPASNNTLVRLSADRRTILATYTDIPIFYDAHILPDGRFALLSRTGQNHTLSIYTAEGILVDDAQLEAPASLSTYWDGNLLVYSQGGLWLVDNTGTWSLALADAPRRMQTGAVHITQERLYLFNGTQLTAYNRTQEMLWQATTPPASGIAQLQEVDSTVIISTNHGELILVNDAGGYCNQLRVFGTDGARQWLALGTDNRLRFAVADQILGIDWQVFTAPCRN
ncbi:MAG: peptidoglycan DD-metalloendopeptidase family protein [Chloroflexota bacterium]